MRWQGIDLLSIVDHYSGIVVSQQIDHTAVVLQHRTVRTEPEAGDSAVQEYSTGGSPAAEVGRHPLAQVGRGGEGTSATDRRVGGAGFLAGWRH